MKGQWRFLILMLATLFLSRGGGNLDAAPDDIDLPAKGPLVQNPGQFDLDDATFEANLFSPYGNAKAAREKVNVKLQLQINEINRICNLSESQIQKLKLAASSDIKRYFDDTDALQKEFKGKERNQENWNQVWQKIHVLQTRLSAGLFNDSSFFAKTLHNTLTEEQNEQYATLTSQRARSRYRASIENALISIENTVPLRHTQREAIIKLLYEETKPPLLFGQYDQIVIQYRLSKLPEGKLKPILEDRQWNLFQNQLNRGRGMENFLVQQGILAKEEVQLRKAKPRILTPRAVMPNAFRLLIPADATRPENWKAE